MSTSPTTTSTGEPEVPKSVLHRAIGASAIGNAVEWFDYGVYAVTAVYIAGALFESDNAATLTLLGYAVSFLFRPLGGAIWGPLGDKIGRKRVLAMTILLMSGATLAVGLIPSYAQIGIWAGVLLFVCRTVQGFSAGGEYGGAATFMAEYAPRNKRGFYGSFLEVGTLAGFAGGAAFVLALLQFLSESQMQDWGWRIPFFVAAPLGLIGMYLRSRMEDTPIFRELEAKEEEQEEISGIYKILFGKYLRPMAIMFCMVISVNVVNYTLLSYSPTYFETELDMSTNDALIAILIGQVAMAIVLPFIGALSDKTGRRPMWLFSCAATAFAAIPMYHLMGASSTGAIIGFLVIGLLYAPQLATISATFPAMYPTVVRFAGVALAYNVSTAAFGGTSPLVNDRMIEATGDNIFPAYYTVAACVIGFIASWFLIETKGESLRGTEIPGTPEAHAEQTQLNAERGNA
ncbi:MFS transporter [Demetria terragena]|uniref:MFS transporter n=1 Tax=Demetria terragena TaxID=63959 RepID=UPI000688AD01|nr:MFS transporter [Demetria terragena]